MADVLRLGRMQAVPAGGGEDPLRNEQRHRALVASEMSQIRAETQLLIDQTRALNRNLGFSGDQTADIDERLVALSGQVSAMNVRLLAAEAAITALEARMTAAEAGIAANAADIATNASDISALDGRVTALEAP